MTADIICTDSDCLCELVLTRAKYIIRRRFCFGVSYMRFQNLTGAGKNQMDQIFPRKWNSIGGYKLLYLSFKRLIIMPGKKVHRDTQFGDTKRCIGANIKFTAITPRGRPSLPIKYGCKIPLNKISSIIAALSPDIPKDNAADRLRYLGSCSHGHINATGVSIASITAVITAVSNIALINALVSAFISTFPQGLTDQI